MKEILVALLQNPIGICMAVLMGFTILTFFFWYGFYIIALPAMSLISVVKATIERHRETSDQLCVAVGPQLGLTMADGGKSIHEDEE
ncbi:MAG: hypothetical protein SVW57_02315 [Thermodesulfobacteriota bacterium]|nr:hypothetical protein [Thermodesulfobacteriota bacterium]